MGLMDILQQYGSRATTPSQSAHDHFDEVARTAPSDVLGGGLADALRSEQTPALGEMIGQMFGRSNPQQKADTLNQLLRSLGPGVVAALGSGILGRLGSIASGAHPQVTPQQASQLTPEQVQEIANRAEQHDPSVFDKLGGFYAQHPQLVKTLGSAALTVALASMANRMNRRA
jgi:hypothetical protein